MTPCFIALQSRRQAEYVLDRIRGRFQACSPRTSSGQDTDRVLPGHQSDRGESRASSSPFSATRSVPAGGGGQVRPRLTMNFSPSISRDAPQAMRQTIRGWRVQLKNDKGVADLSAMLGPDPEGMAAILRPFPRLGAQVGLAAREPVLDLVADAQAQEGGGLQNARRRNAQTAGATSATSSIGRWAHLS